jgi:hypothetical protein
LWHINIRWKFMRTWCYCTSRIRFSGFVHIRNRSQRSSRCLSFPTVSIIFRSFIFSSTCIGKIINYLQLYTETPLQIYYNNYGETTKSYNIVILNPYNVSDQVTILS